MYTEYDYNNELYHHGIKGQKWGVRRYQNADGSYTGVGRRRYGIGSLIVDINKKRHQSAAKAARRDADSLRKAGYVKEANAVEKVAKKQEAKANGNFKLSDKQKKAIKIGAVVAGTALAAYATYKIAGPKIAAYRNNKAIQASVSRARTLLQTGNQNSRNYAKKTIFQANSRTRKAAVDRRFNKEFRSVNNVYGVDLVKPVNVSKPGSSRNFSSGSRTNFRVSGRASTNSAMSRRGINRPYTAKVRSDNAKVKQMTAELMKDHNWDSKTAENYAWWQLRNRGAYFGK